MPSTETGSAYPNVARDRAGRTPRSRETSRDTTVDRPYAVPIASLSGPQRRIVSALLEAARIADAKKASDGSR